METSSFVRIEEKDLSEVARQSFEQCYLLLCQEDSQLKGKLQKLGLELSNFSSSIQEKLKKASHILDEWGVKDVNPEAIQYKIASEIVRTLDEKQKAMKVVNLHKQFSNSHQTLEELQHRFSMDVAFNRKELEKFKKEFSIHEPSVSKVEDTENCSTEIDEEPLHEKLIKDLDELEKLESKYKELKGQLAKFEGFPSDIKELEKMVQDAELTDLKLEFECENYIKK